MLDRRQLTASIVVMTLFAASLAGAGIAGAADAGTEACDPAMGTATDGVSTNSGCGSAPSDDPGGNTDGGDGMDCEYFCLPSPLPQP